MEREVELENAFLKCSSVGDAEKLLEKCKSGDIMVSLHDANAVYIRVSASSSELIGYAESELVGNSGYDYFHPDDFQAILKSHAKVTIKPEVDEVEYRIRKS
ncbi:MAG: PAS domain-containing protein, partial [Flavobacteriales bacterium]